jgi:hypothetical protein
LRFFQIISDSGRPLFKDGGPWIEATPERRTAALQAFEKWVAPSTSAPTEGLAVALEEARRVSNAAVYLITDDWAVGGRVALEKRLGAEGFGNVQVSTIALPTIYDVTHGQLYTAADLATLGHELAVRSGGVFVGAPANARLEKCAEGHRPVPARCGQPRQPRRR